MTTSGRRSSSSTMFPTSLLIWARSSRRRREASRRIPDRCTGRSTRESRRPTALAPDRRQGGARDLAAGRVRREPLLQARLEDLGAVDREQRALLDLGPVVARLVVAQDGPRIAAEREAA